MRSTGEVMGIDADFGFAYAKSQLAASQFLPREGGVLFSVKDADKAAALELAKGFQAQGFRLYATAGTADFLQKHGLPVQRVHKIREGRPHIIDHIKNNDIHLLINTPEGRYTPADSYSIRRAALEYNTPYTTTLAAARATLDAIRAMKRGKLTVKSIQEYHAMVKQATAKLRAVKG
jgi:carbamoyl-phosphate synthase large subunit